MHLLSLTKGNYWQRTVFRSIASDYQDDREEELSASENTAADYLFSVLISNLLRPATRPIIGPQDLKGMPYAALLRAFGFSDAQMRIYANRFFWGGSRWADV